MPELASHMLLGNLNSETPMLPLGIQSWDTGGQGQIKALELGRREAERVREGSQGDGEGCCLGVAASPFPILPSGSLELIPKDPL